MINRFKSWLTETWFTTIRTRWARQSTDIYKNPSLRELLRSRGEGEGIRAIFDGDDVYVWRPTLAMHEEVFKKLKLGSSAVYAMIIPSAKNVMVVQGSQLQVSQLRKHPYTKKMGFKVQ